MALTPTPEQQAAIDGFSTGHNLVIEAGAGTGKTSTLLQIAQTVPNRSGLYLAFNKAIQTEAERKFADTRVLAKTAHSLAYAQFGRPNQAKLARGNRMRGGDRAEALGIHGTLAIQFGGGDRRVTRSVQTRLVTDAVANFCRSDAVELTADMVPTPDALMLSDEETRYLQEKLLPYAQKYWADIVNPDGILPFTHDHYLKMWAMSKPRLDYDYILFDEAQDADPLIAGVVKAQEHAQIVAVGDRNQAIYGWRGAVDAMSTFGGDQFQLTQSFRFGHEIAAEANEWLEYLEASLRIVGTDKPSSVHLTMKRLADAVLCRTNAGAIAEVIFSQELGARTAISGKGKAMQMRKLAEAAKSLIEQGWTSHPELDTFRSWDEVREYAEEDEGADMKPLVKLVDTYGPERLIGAIDACVPEDADPRTTIATAHVAKGLEWNHVRISDDFKVPNRDDEASDDAGRLVMETLRTDEAMLSYVAVTRAMRHLDPGGLSFIRQYKRTVSNPAYGLEWRRRMYSDLHQQRELVIANNAPAAAGRVA